MPKSPPKPGFTFSPGPPPEVLAYFKAKKLKPGFDYRDVWREEHAHAFTVAKAMSLDLLTTFKDSIESAITEGKPFRQFQKELTPTLQKLGWWGKQKMTDPKTGEAKLAQLGSPRRLKTIYQANLRTAHSAGQWERAQRTKNALPYLRYSLGPSREHRAEHTAWHGLLLPVDSPWWSTHMPPNGWGCKCRVRQVSRVEAKRRGWEPGKPPPLKKKRWKNTRTGKSEWVPTGIDPGWDTNPGKVRAAQLSKALADKLAAAPAAIAEKAQDAIPLLTDELVLGKKLADAKGSNPGGLYQGVDGARRYVKFYDDPAQAYSEAVAHRIYRELGHDAPESALFVHQGKLALATSEVTAKGTLGKVGLTKTRAQKVLDGFAADVWLANWDAVGLDLDNVLVTGKSLVRIDNGGTLLFRARAGRKPPERLKQVSEWEGFANTSRNPAYARVFKSAGITSADELGRKALNQIKAIQELGKRTKKFEALVPVVSGVPEKDRLAILEILRERAILLNREVAPRIRGYLKSPKLERELKALLGSEFDRMLSNASGLVKQAGGNKHGLTNAEMVGLHGYTLGHYDSLNKALRGESGPDGLVKFKPLIKAATLALGKLPDIAGPVNRGTFLPDAELKKHKAGNTVRYKAFTSASTGEGFGGSHRFRIQSQHGKDVKFISGHPGENEVLFAPGTSFQVLSRKTVGGKVYFEMEELETKGKATNRQEESFDDWVDRIERTEAEGKLPSVPPHLQSKMDSSGGVADEGETTPWDEIKGEK